ncbi:hypothetical protein C2G38_2209233 [Gigaspora rosea]|uniref:Uncharacterized protein n=1 Tax=Gigaspora rosea TaxID=44941 RepID=A0A397UPK7_9GLOM|nr:hypothetical protein C2G38_2209233 [Gigaspora rosea]
MASMFCAISFIKNASNANKYTAGTAVYRASQKDPPISTVPETLNTEPIIDKGKNPSTFDNNININNNFTSLSNTTYPPFDIPTTSPNMSDPSNCS